MGMAYTKSPKGSREATGRTHDLPEFLLGLLKSCKGRFSVDEVVGRAAPEERKRVEEAMAMLIAGGYLREAPEALLDQDEDEIDGALAEEGAPDETPPAQPVVDTPGQDDGEFDDTADKLRSEVARRRGQRNEDAAEVVRQLDETARRKAEEKAAREAEERARIEAEEKARREAEEQARREAEEKARRDAEERARIEAEEKARREAEEARRRAEEEKRRKEAERKAREEAAERARLEQEERDRAAIQERLRKRKEQQRRVLWPLLAVLILPMMLVGALHLFSFDGRRAEFEAAASKVLGAPVKAGSAKLWLLPSPQWRFADVTVTAAAGTIRAAHVALAMPWTGIFGNSMAFTGVDLENPDMPPAVALQLLMQGAPDLAGKSFAVSARGLVFGAAMKDLPPLALNGSVRDGKLAALSGGGENAESGKVKFDLAREDDWQLRLEAAQLRWLFGPEVPMRDAVMQGKLAPGGLTLREFSAAIFGGDIGGSATLTWDGGWRIGGKLTAKRLDAEKLAKAWVKEGAINGNAVLAANAAMPRDLLPRASLGGSFSIERGVIAGVDFDKVLQERGVGEEFRFVTLGGDFVLDSGRLDVSNIRIASDQVTASGSLSVDTSRAVNGRLQIEARSASARKTGSVRIGGTLAAPGYLR